MWNRAAETYVIAREELQERCDLLALVLVSLIMYRQTCGDPDCEMCWPEKSRHRDNPPPYRWPEAYYGRLA
jgi:hypothetical protein